MRQSARAASTSSACVAGLTSCMTFLTFPSASITNVERLDAPVLLPEVRLLAPDAVLLGDGMVGVGEQRERKVVLVLELHVRAFVVGRDSEHDCAARSNSPYASRIPQACFVQPGVSSLG